MAKALCGEQFDEVLVSHSTKLRVVTNQIGELAALVDEMTPCEALYLLLEVRHAEELGEHEARVVEAERLVEVRRDEKVAGGGGSHHHGVLTGLRRRSQQLLYQPLRELSEAVLASQRMNAGSPPQIIEIPVA